MSFNLSTGLQQALLSKTQEVSVSLIANTISMGDGDGVAISGADTINDSGAGLSAKFAKHDWILVISDDANTNTLVKALDVSTSKIEVVAGSFIAVAAGTNISLVKLKSFGTVLQCFQNSVMVGYTTTRPINADAVEVGTKLLEITKDGATFTASASLNGLNLGADAAGTTLNRAVDPETGAAEVWQGTGVADGTCGYMRWYANDFTTGDSATAIRMDGLVATSGQDITMANGTAIVIGAISNVTSVSLTMTGV